MTKDDGFTIIVYAIMLVAAIFIGTQIIGPALSDLNLSTSGERYGFAIIAIVLGALLSSIIFEVGHLIGAKLGGYMILSINIWGLSIYREGKKWKFGFKSFEGLTGEVKIAPKKENANPRWYLWGPTILFLIEVVILLFVYVNTPSEPPFTGSSVPAFIHHSSFIFIAVGAMLAIYNIVPFKLDTINDGHQLVLISNKVNVEAFNELRRIDGAYTLQQPVGDIKTFEQITTLTTEVNLRAIYELQYKNEDEAALELIESIDISEVQLDPIMKARLYAQKIWVLIKLGKIEEVEKLWESLTTKTKKAIGDDTNLETIRVYFLYSGVVAKSIHESTYAINRLPKERRKKRKHPRFDEETKLMSDAIALVRQTNPDWQIALRKEAK